MGSFAAHTQLCKIFIGGFVTEPPTQEPQTIDHRRNALAPGPAGRRVQEVAPLYRRFVTELPTQEPWMKNHCRNALAPGPAWLDAGFDNWGGK